MCGYFKWNSGYMQISIDIDNIILYVSINVSNMGGDLYLLKLRLSRYTLDPGYMDSGNWS